MLSRLGSFFFRYRDLLPVPLALALLKRAKPRFLGWMAGMPFILLGESLRVWALMHIGPTTRTREICADTLVQTGPYACTRNPLYLANLLKVLGILIIAGNLPLGLAILSFYAIEFPCIIAYEESFLTRRFPDQFPLYKSKVPVFIPHVPDFLEPRKSDYSFFDALTSEKKTFGSTGLILGLLSLAGWINSRPMRYPEGVTV